MKKILLLFLIFVFQICQAQLIEIPNKATFRALAFGVNHEIWASGSHGSILKSTDNGISWQNFCPEIYKDYDFRGIAVLNQNEVIAMSAGDAKDHKAFLIKTLDGGLTWQKVFQSATPGVFFDCINFSDDKLGFLLSDPIDSKPMIFKTIDGGLHWDRLSPEIFPPLINNESSFAASNSNIEIVGNNIWVCTQNRIFKSEDLGATWKVYPTPFSKSNSEGIFGMHFMDDQNGFAVGGDYLANPKAILQVVETNDGGKSWPIEINNFGFGVTESIAIAESGTWIRASSLGLQQRINGNWKMIENGVYHVVKCKNKNCIAVGSKGNIFRFEAF